MNQHVYKVCGRAEWEAARARGAYEGSPDDARDGFIHLSTAEQLAGTLAKHFAGRDDLLLIAFEAAKMGPSLKWEASRGGALFPHFYGPLDVSAALSVEPLARNSEGLHVLPAEVA
jgi:uncharacterized protein (DUF952 family)